MLRIDQNFVSRLRVPKGTPSPKPFPGRYPTRISARWLDPKDHRILREYIGKPSLALNRLIYTHQKDLLVGLVEFDRVHKIVQYDALKDGPMWSRHLFPIYHPGVDGGPLDGFVQKNFWLESLLHPRKLTDKFSYYLAPIQTLPSAVKGFDTKVASMLAVKSAEQAAQRAALKEALRAKRKASDSRFGYKVPF
jgi:hypothetical protein